jgi:hypothetical protein
MSRKHAQPVLELIGKLKEGLIHGKSLSVAERRACVGYLTGESISIPEIAQLLGRDERTIQRDRASIRAQNALSVSPGFINEVAGEMLREARGCAERIRRRQGCVYPGSASRGVGFGPGIGLAPSRSPDPARRSRAALNPRELARFGS